MTFTVTIDGNTRSLQAGTMSIALRANERATMNAQVYSATGSWRPDLNEEVVITADSVVIFGGYIETALEAGAGQQPIAAILTDITASDYNSIPSRKLVAEARPSETLKVRLQWLIDNHLDDYGVSLDAGQATGPTLEATAYAYESIDSILTGLATLAGPDYIWRIDFTKKLKVYSASGVSAPFNVSVGSGHAIGDITVEPSRNGFANRVIVQAGTSRIVDKTDPFTGDGSTTAFTLRYPMVYTPTVGYGYVTYDGNSETLDLTGVAGAMWEYAPAANTITRDTAPANTKAISITYPAQFPIWVAADGGAAAADVVMIKIDRPDVYDIDEAQAIADAELAARDTTTKTVSYSTKTAGLLPGQTQTITNSSRGLSAVSCVITEVTITNDIGPNYLRYAVKAIASGPITTWRNAFKTLGSSNTSTSLGGSSIAVAASQGGWNGEAPQLGDVGMGVGGFLSSAAAMTYNRLSSTNAWGLAVGSDAYGDFFGLANKVTGEWAWKTYEISGSTLAFCPPTGTSMANWLGSSAGSSLRWAQLHIARGKIYEGGFTSGIGEWPTYTPSLVSVGGSPSIGTGGTLTGREMRVGNTGLFAFELTLGTSFSFGTGNVGITLPQTASANNRGDMGAFAIDTGTAGYPLIATRTTIGGAQVCGIYQWASPLAAITTTVPFTFASGDVISGAGWFEV